MTGEEAIKKINEAKECGDTELAHVDADSVLCELLESLGYSEVVSAYRKVDKWYA